MTDREMLELAMAELDAAHQEITRLDAASAIGSQSPLSGLSAVRSYMDVKQYDKAYIWACAMRERMNGNTHFLRGLRDLQVKRGEISQTLLLANAIAAKDKSIPPRSIRRLEGRLRELSGWVPSITGGKRELEPPIAGRVLHLVKESRPFLSNGFTSRSHRNFIAEAKAGLEPIVVTEPGFPRELVGSDFKRRELVDDILHVRLDLGDIDYKQMPVDEYLEYFAQLAYEEVLRTRPSVIHASSGRRGYETALVGLSLKEKTGLPFIYEVRSFFEANWTGDVAWETSGEVFNRRMWVEEMCMHGADRVLTIGVAMKEELISRGIPESKIGIIPNAVDLADFVPKTRDGELSAKYHLDGFQTFGYVSNMDHYRESQETLIEACALMKDMGSESRCVLVGGGNRIPLLRKMAEDLGVSDRVVFTGAIDHKDIAKYYSLIDIFVVPRIRERAATYVTPLKPFEAMASGIPLVVSNLPALVEIAEPPLRGESFVAGDPESLADTLQRLYNDQEECRRMSERSYEWVRTERTWDSNGSRYVEEFRHLDQSQEVK
ncbi:glycosyltransferase family 4 protein [Arthrobacter roseus]|uniref:glycosyltransferase family 4 protein n=1 Tax=Arthrobacter roseus TaxID=136274 RepID=UPI001964DFFB|nr:glycosyltransferase family 4 protein [Arthrobacter roseus]MBM7848916.1 glycosyltransferase involved in cell wall biosynthesis [Arthrobacter roseus]